MPHIPPLPGLVHIVDDQPAMLRMVAELVESIALQARTYLSAQAFFERYHPQQRECLVSDVRMPGTGGLEFLQLIQQRGFCLPVMFITGYAEIGTAVASMKLGAFDYIEKPFSHQEFLDKVLRAQAESELRYVRAMQRRAAQARLDLLTPTERKVLKLVAAGKTSREIGEVLKISSRTVDNHRGRMMEKLHVGSAVELALAYTVAVSPAPC